MSATGLSAQVADAVLAVGRQRPPGRTVQAVKDRLLHGLGVALVSSRLRAAEVAWQAVSGDQGPCTVIGRRGTLSVSAAGFANAVAAHSSLQEDCGPGGLAEGSHPGTYVLPAALAAAESVDAPGAALVRAIAAGYEAVGRVGEIAPVSIVSRRFRPLGVLGPIGAAAAAGTIFGCDQAQLAAAMSIAANSAAGYGQGFVTGSMEPYLHAGYAARNGLLAASVARAGATASPNSFEGPYGFFQTYGGQPGRDAAEPTEQAVVRLGTKRFAACLQNQETLMLIQAKLPVPLDMESVLGVRLYRPATPGNGTASPGVGSEPPYETMLQRQMSARFTAAAALLGRPVDDVRYFEEAGADAPAASLAERVALISTQEPTVRIEVDLADGNMLSADGDMSAMLFPPSDEIRDRFLARARSVIGADAEPLCTAIDGLEELTSVSVLSRYLRPQAA
jgi:2-methylcitrate dehydratase PrpD